MRKIVLIVIALVVIAGLAVLLGVFRTSRVAADIDRPLTQAQMTEFAPRGRELALAGDCFGCHSTEDGPMGAGGVPIATPFGTLYSSNITPDPTFGIGGYTRAEFHRALRDGVGRGGRSLYPAMPYVYTQVTTPEDADALYAYVMSIPPIPRQTPDNTGVFVLPVRMFMNAWNLLNFPVRNAPNDPERSATWNRGAYLVEGLAHCGGCHTPMNAMMAPDFSRALEGASIDGLEAPAITPAALRARDYDLDTLTQFLATGIAPQGTAFGAMYMVTHFSTSVMEHADVEAIATYLLTDGDGALPPPRPAPSPAPAPEALEPAPGATPAPGRIVYAGACAGCHGMAGEGIPNVAPAMKGNTTLALADPLNLLSVIVNGIPTRTFAGNQRMYAMPPFARDLSDRQIADLATWLRAEWGDQSETVSVERVAGIERAVD